MLAAVILAAVLALIAAVALELVKRPLRSSWARAAKWFRLIRGLPRLDQAVENIAWMIAYDEADYGTTTEEHQQAIQDLHDYLTGRRSSDGLHRKPRTHSAEPSLTRF